MRCRPVGPSAYARQLPRPDSRQSLLHRFPQLFRSVAAKWLDGALCYSSQVDLAVRATQRTAFLALCQGVRTIRELGLYESGQLLAHGLHWRSRLEVGGKPQHIGFNTENPRLMPGKIDVKKQYKALFAPRRVPHVVEVPTFRFLTVDGQVAPESQAFQDAIGALYSILYTMKFMLKEVHRIDFVVPLLEVLWWSDDPSAFNQNRRDEWKWTAMLMQLEHITEADLEAAVAALDKKGKATPAHEKIRTASLEEGRAVQVMYVGPCDSMGATIQTMRRFAESRGLKLVGKHHDIYLSDPRRTAPEKLKTVLRHPVA